MELLENTVQIAAQILQDTVQLDRLSNDGPSHNSNVLVKRKKDWIDILHLALIHIQ